MGLTAQWGTQTHSQTVMTQSGSFKGGAPDSAWASGKRQHRGWVPKCEWNMENRPPRINRCWNPEEPEVRRRRRWGSAHEVYSRPAGGPEFHLEGTGEPWRVKRRGRGRSEP